jgi:hypothetical protein
MPRTIAPPELWGVGQFRVGGESVVWELSQAEIMRDGQSAAAALGAVGLPPGGRVLITSMLSEAPHFWPLTLGVLMSGAQLSSADATPFDAYRTAMFLRTLRYDVALGVSDAVLDGLEQMGADLAALFGAVPTVLARGGACARLEAVGLHPTRMVLLGPATAIARSPGGPPEVDPELWELEPSDGEIVVTSLTPRRQPFVRQSTGVRGTIDGPRIILE